MTVCIAVINQKEKAIVYASDRMVTSGYPPVEFEHPIPKLSKLHHIASFCRLVMPCLNKGFANKFKAK